jgi:hypothetical protein
MISSISVVDGILSEVRLSSEVYVKHSPEMIDSLRQRFDNNNNRELACLINHRNLKI